MHDLGIPEIDHRGHYFIVELPSCRSAGSWQLDREARLPAMFAGSTATGNLLSRLLICPSTSEMLSMPRSLCLHHLGPQALRHGSNATHLHLSVQGEDSVLVAFVRTVFFLPRPSAELLKGADTSPSGTLNL